LLCSLFDPTASIADLIRYGSWFQAKPMDKKIEGQTRLKPVTQSHRTKALQRSATSAGPPDSTDKIALSARY
jgi:hypothetical protein